MIISAIPPTLVAITGFWQAIYSTIASPNPSHLEGSKAINSIDINNRETIKTLIVLFLITLIMCSILHLIVKNKNEDKDIIEKHIS